MDWPSVVVIIPTYGRKKELVRCVSSLLSQDYPNYRIVIIDDASPEPVSHTWFKNIKQVSILRNKTNQKQAASRNRGIRSANADYYILIDDDCYVADLNWIKKHVSLNQEFPKSLIGGKIVNVTDSLWGKARAALTRDGLQYGSFLQTMNLSFSRTTFKVLGGFNEVFGELEDVDFSQRAKRQGISLKSDSSTAILHQFDDQFRAILKRNFQYGKWVVPVRKGQHFDGHWILPGSLITSLVLYLPLSIVSSLAQVLLALPKQPATIFLSPLIFCYTLAHSAGMVCYHWKSFFEMKKL